MREEKPIAAPPEDYWRDDHHETIRVSFVAPNGQAVQEMGSHDFPAPMNRNTAAPIDVRIEIVHADGCSRRLSQRPLEVY